MKAARYCVPQTRMPFKHTNSTMNIYDLDMLRTFYESYKQRVEQAREKLARPLTCAEKILFAHLTPGQEPQSFMRGESYATFRPDRVCMQDATAQMAILQFMNAGRELPEVPTTIHCDHLIRAQKGADTDLSVALNENSEVYRFLQSAAERYGMGFWKPGAGIIHQVMLENYAFPGGMMVGTDSHTPNAGGLGMVAIGVGGADAVDVMTATPWELKVPKLIGVKLVGELSGWASPKDVILHLAGILTTKGGTNAIVEYFGPGTATLPATGKATICNMGAEIGATTSVFPFDDHMAEYLVATGRKEVADMAQACAAELRADSEVAQHPEQYYDQVITIDLSALTPYVNGPFTPDAATPVSEMKAKVEQENLPPVVEVVLIGSCTNSSYHDIARAEATLRKGLEAGLELKAQLILCPGSELVCQTLRRDGLLDTFVNAGATIMTNACGPCIGQWKRENPHPERPNSIVTTFNRNFAKRADGNPNTYAFITSPETAVGFAFSGTLCSHPCLEAQQREMLQPEGEALPHEGYHYQAAAAVMPPYESHAVPTTEIVIAPNSERLQRLQPFAPWDGKDFLALPLLLKAKGKCTTDHISMAGPWLRYRGHLQNISRNLLLGAVNAFTGETAKVKDQLNGQTAEPWQVAEHYREACSGSVVVAEDNYGEGSSREHAAMEPRYLGVKAVIAKSFARIHETNLKKQGVLALTFANPADYALVVEGSRFNIHCASIAPGSMVMVDVVRPDGIVEHIETRHTYNAAQIEWFKAGSALRAK